MDYKLLILALVFMFPLVATVQADLSVQNNEGWNWLEVDDIVGVTLTEDIYYYYFELYDKGAPENYEFEFWTNADKQFSKKWLMIFWTNLNNKKEDDGKWKLHDGYLTNDNFGDVFRIEKSIIENGFTIHIGNATNVLVYQDQSLVRYNYTNDQNETEVIIDAVLEKQNETDQSYYNAYPNLIVNDSVGKFGAIDETNDGNDTYRYTITNSLNQTWRKLEENIYYIKGITTDYKINFSDIANTTDVISYEVNGSILYVTFENYDGIIDPTIENFDAPATVNDVFVYDRTKDTIGTNWFNDSSKSWWLEANATDTNNTIRSNTTDFPEVTYLIANDDGLDIIDASDGKLWMRFEQLQRSGQTSSSCIFDSGSGEYPNVVTALNGKVYMGQGHDTGTLRSIDFINERCNVHTDTITYTVTVTNGGTDVNISERNNAAYAITSNKYSIPRIFGRFVHDIESKVINGNDIVTVMTDDYSGNNGGITITNMSGGNYWGHEYITGPTDSSVLSITPDNKVVYGDSATDKIYIENMPFTGSNFTSDVNTSMTNPLVLESNNDYIFAGTTDRGIIKLNSTDFSQASFYNITNGIIKTSNNIQALEFALDNTTLWVGTNESLEEIDTIDDSNSYVMSLTEGVSLPNYDVIALSNYNINTTFLSNFTSQKLLIGYDTTKYSVLNPFSNSGIYCGSTLTSSLTMEADLHMVTGEDECTGNGLRTGADNLVIDCAGFNINGVSNAGMDLRNDNITVKDCNIEGFAYGSYLIGSNNVNLINNSINISNDCVRMWSQSSSGLLFENNTCYSSGDDGISMEKDGCDDILVKNNSFSCVGYGIAVTANCDNWTIENNNFIDVGSFSMYFKDGETTSNLVVNNNNIYDRIYLASDGANKYFYNNIVNSSNNFLSLSSGGGDLDLEVYNNSVTGACSNGVFYWDDDNDNVKIYDNFVNVSDGYVLIATVADGSLIEGLEISNNTLISTGDDTLRFKNAVVLLQNNSLTAGTGNNELYTYYPATNQITLIDQPLERYSLGDLDNFTVENTQYGKIEFLERVADDGETNINFNTDINISYNLITVDSDNHPGFNVSANLSFYNINITDLGASGVGEIIALRDGLECDGSICGDLSNSLVTAPDVYNFYFNVSEFTNYSVGEELISPYLLINFTNPTPPNATITSNRTFIVNITVNSSHSLTNFDYYFNGTSYKFLGNYSGSDHLAMILNLDNVSALGENDTTIVDVSPQDHFVNTSNMGNMSFVEGVYDKALDITDASTYLHIPDFDNGNIYTVPANDNNFALSFWIKTTDTSSRCSFISDFSTAPAQDYGWWLGMANGNVSVGLENGPSEEKGINIADGEWHHVFMRLNTISIFNFKVYIDGVETLSTGNFVYDGDPDNEFRIGKSAGGSPIDGCLATIDEFRLYANAFVSNEPSVQGFIDYVYNSNLNEYDTNKWLFYINQTKSVASPDLDYGTYTYQACANNTQAGNCTETRIIEISSNLYPNITFISPTPNDGSNLSQDYIEVNVSALDDIGIDTITIYLYNNSGDLEDSQTSGSSPFFYNFTGLNDGTYLINASVNDTSGLLNWTDDTRTITLDTTAPNINILKNDTSIIETQYIYTNCTTSDDLIGLDTVLFNIVNASGVIVAENNTINFASIIYQAVNGTGTYNITCFANDSLGNSNTVIDSFTVTENKFPNITFISPTTETGNYSQDYIEVNVSALDDIGIDTITIYIYNSTGGILQTNTSSSSPHFVNFTSLADGIYLLNASVNDTSDQLNWTEDTREILLDTTPPVITITRNPTTAVQGVDDVDFTVGFTDALLDIDVAKWNVTYPDGSLLDSGTGNISDTIVTALLTQIGTYTILGYANDTLGNEDTDTKTFDVVGAPIPSLTLNLNVSIVKVQLNRSIRIYWNYTVAGGRTPDFANFTVFFPDDSVLTNNNLNNGTLILDEENLTQIGFYNVSFFLNDSQGNFSFVSALFNASNLTIRLTNVKSSGISRDSAIITWNTDELTNSTVYYGINSSDLNESSGINNYVKSHSITLTGLAANTTYYYYVQSCYQPIGICVNSTQYSFMTRPETPVTADTGIFNLAIILGLGIIMGIFTYLAVKMNSKHFFLRILFLFVVLWMTMILNNMLYSYALDIGNSTIITAIEQVTVILTVAIILVLVYFVILYIAGIAKSMMAQKEPDSSDVNL